MDPSFVTAIESSSSFLLTGHEHPDGDCVGSQVALYHLLRALGKEVTILNPDPVGRPLEFLRRSAPIGSWSSGAELPEAELVVLLDCSQLERTGELGRALRARSEAGALQVAVIDHHVGSEKGDGTVSLVDPSAAATGSLVLRMFHHWGVEPGREAAEALFVSLTADTGWFRYSNTDAGVFEAAASLVRAGADPCALYDRMFRRNHRSSIDILADGLAITRFSFDDRLGMLALDKAMMDRVGKAGFDTDLLMEPVRSVAGVEVVALLKERFDGQVKLSMRAVGDIDVQVIAAGFGGGGHKKAAGATLSIPLATAIDEVQRAIAAAMGIAEEAT